MDPSVKFTDCNGHRLEEGVEVIGIISSGKLIYGTVLGGEVSIKNNRPRNRIWIDNHAGSKTSVTNPRFMVNFRANIPIDSRHPGRDVSKKSDLFGRKLAVGQRVLCTGHTGDVELCRVSELGSRGGVMAKPVWNNYAYQSYIRAPMIIIDHETEHFLQSHIFMNKVKSADNK